MVKIFVITTENSVSAIELHKDGNGHFYEHQLLSTCNRVPSDYHKTIGSILRLELNVMRIKNDLMGFETAIRVHSSLLLNQKDIKTDKHPNGFRYLNRDDDDFWGEPGF